MIHLYYDFSRIFLVKIAKLYKQSICESIKIPFLQSFQRPLFSLSFPNKLSISFSLAL